MLHWRSRRVVQAVAIAAAMFGVATAIVGTRALLGAGPGYVIYLPLLRFNAIMGVAYVAVGVIAWRNLKLAVYGAGAICVLNLLALGFIAYLYTPDGRHRAGKPPGHDVSNDRVGRVSSGCCCGRSGAAGPGSEAHGHTSPLGLT